MSPPFEVVTKVMVKLLEDMLSNLMLPDGLAGISITARKSFIKFFEQILSNLNKMKQHVSHLSQDQKGGI